MKKIVLTLIVSFLTLVGFSQKKNIQNAYNSFRQETNGVRTKITEAKHFIDLAYNHESTSNDPKMWNYRSKIYLEIMLKQPELYENAVFEATEAHIRCLDRDKKGRIAVRKWTKEEDVLNGLAQCGYYLFNSGVEDYNAKNYSTSIKKYKEIFRIIPLDKDNLLKRGNIVPDAIYYNLYLAALQLEDISAQIEYLQKSIDNNTNNPGVYIGISSAYAKNGDTEKALEYINIGRELFDSDIQLINAEIDLYIKIGKSTEEIIQKLTDAIELDNSNYILYIIRGQQYLKLNEYEKSETDFLEAYEINSEIDVTNRNIASYYIERAQEIVNENDNKLNKSESKKVKRLREKSLPFFMKIIEISKENDAYDYESVFNLALLYDLIDRANDCKLLLQELVEYHTENYNSIWLARINPILEEID